MKALRAVGGAVLLLTAGAAARGQAPPRPPPADHAARFERGRALFAEKVRPLLEQHCLRCHGGDSTRAQFDMATREGLLTGGKNGEVVVPFDAAASRLLKLVAHEEAPAMPFKREPLSEGDVALLKEWVELGAAYDRPLIERPEAAAAARREIGDAERAFWSFQPLVRPAMPELADLAWCRTDVDRFVRAAQEAADVRPADRASRRVLVRRAWFDLLGLPPPPDEVAAFIADDDPAAWPKLVRRLLASDHFGERFARHWLDVARFAESHGFEHDYDRPHAFTYRDFVIRALNADLPFDRFVQWQIAGDELAPDDPEAWFATGFLGAGVHATQITASQVEKERYDELDDVVNTVGTSMLGLTVGCARCHDHKFDPIPARDYYGMVATFTKTVRSDCDVVLNAEEHRRELAAWQVEEDRLAGEFARFEREELPGRFAAWLARRARQQPEPVDAAGSASPAAWLAVEPASIVSAGGALFTAQGDGSWLASGPRVERDAWTVAVDLPPDVVPSVAAVRIEALADPSLPHGGPGRADNGNFGLTELRAEFTPAAGTAAQPPVALPLVRARSTFDQAGLPAAAAIDGADAVDGPCWAVDPQFGKDHAAAFDLVAPQAAAGGGRLTLHFVFNTNVFHAIGRLRVSVAAAGGQDLQASTEPWFTTQDPEWRARRDALDRHRAARPKPRVQKALVCSEGLPAIRLHTQGGDFLEATHFLKRGDPNQKGDVMAPAFLQVLTRTDEGEERWRGTAPAEARTPGQRRALALWLTDVEQGAGALLARVIVNRLWHHLLGRGIVATPNDFGAMGERPSHPELLDWLAAELVLNRWSLKHVIELILTSSVYQMGAGWSGDGERGGGDADAGAAPARSADPENRLFSRHPPRRLEAEAIRDAMLAVSGLLDVTPFGPGTLDVASHRRSVYLFVKRSKLVPMMALFDAPNALSGIGARQTTTVAPQALFLVNAAASRQWAEAFARRVDVTATSGGDFVRTAFTLAYGRPPTDGELADAFDFLLQAGAAPVRARTDLCHALLSANEFVYVE